MAQKGILSFNANGTENTSFSSSVDDVIDDSVVYAIYPEYNSNRILVGGYLPNYNNTTTKNMFKINLTSGALATCSETYNPTVLSAPVIIVTSKNDNSITISWSAISGATSYDVIVSKNTNPPSFPNWNNTTNTSYTTTGLESNTSYIIYVVAKNNATQSSNSNTIYETTTNTMSYTFYDTMSPGDPCFNPVIEIHQGSDGKYYKYDGVTYTLLYSVNTSWWKYSHFDIGTGLYVYNTFLINADSTTFTPFSNSSSNCESI